MLWGNIHNILACYVNATTQLAFVLSDGWFQGLVICIELYMESSSLKLICLRCDVQENSIFIWFLLY